MTYINKVKRKIEELYQTSDDFGILRQAQLDSNSQTINLL